MTSSSSSDETRLPKESELPELDGNSAYAALRCRDFRWYLAGNLTFLFGSQMQTVAVGWQVYKLTERPLDLGLVGLMQVIPVMLLALPAGQVIDRFDRRRVIMVALVAMAISSIGLALTSLWHTQVGWVFACLVLNGIARPFLQPAKSAFLPQIVPRSIFPNAVTWSTSSFQLATIVGPGVGGLLLGWLEKPWLIYLLDASLAYWFIFTLTRIESRQPPKKLEPLSWQSFSAGLRFLWNTKLLFGAITLDMFAVLFGGATALLPIYAIDILDVGSKGLGWLQAAPGVGALLFSVVIAHRPPIRHAGPTLLLSVVGFGIATIVFGLSRNFWLAWFMLFLTGGLDMISVIIRHTLVQLWTPDAMRGRVSAVNGMFISVSNELGAFESGIVAELAKRSAGVVAGATISVVSGGVGTLLVVIAVACLFPTLRRYGCLNDAPPENSTK